MRKLEVKSLAQGHIASKWESWDLNPDCLDSGDHAFNFSIVPSHIKWSLIHIQNSLSEELL